VGHKLLGEISGEGPVDFVFIDAEKPGYETYFDWAIDHVRIGGVIAAHNAFRGGGVLDGTTTDESTRAIRAFNHRIAAEPRVMSTIYPAGDGTLIAVKVA
jgi:predicted O-methyltransferase YrrM